MTNLLIALKNVVQNPNNDLVAQYRSLNRMNSMGEALEFYIKDIFSSAFSEKDISKKEQKYSKEFSYLGNQNNPPDIIIKNGDAIEVKKHIGARAGGMPSRPTSGSATPTAASPGSRRTTRGG